MESDFYVLFSNNTDAMMADSALRSHGVAARVSPTPYDLQGKAGCGVAILIREKDVGEARRLIETQKLPHVDIVRMPRQINPRRDRYM